jgi:SpoVK/Ycf46/Vps4 family AAA+-type ATPase
LRNVTVVAATNRPDLIDAALLRPGRFVTSVLTVLRLSRLRIDRMIYIQPPDLRTRQEIFSISLRRIPHSADVTAQLLASRTDGYSGAEIAALCREGSFYLRCHIKSIATLQPLSTP